MTWMNVCCDVCGVEYEGEPMDKKESIDARIKLAGWQIRDGYHFCPEHTDSEPNETVRDLVMKRYGYEVTKALNTTAPWRPEQGRTGAANDI